jgi:predicted dehydrogenase
VRAGSYTFRSTDVSIVLDLMIHDLDLVLSLVQAPVVQVDAFGMAVLGPHEDLAHARLRFANGCIADLKASRVSYEPQRTMQVFAPEAFAAIDFAAGSVQVVRPNLAVRRRQVDLTQCPPPLQTELRNRLFKDVLCHDQLDVKPTNAIAEEHRQFVRAIGHGEPVWVTGQQGRDALAVAEQVLQAVARHQWNGTPAGPVGPHALLPPEPQVLRPKAA